VLDDDLYRICERVQASVVHVTSFQAVEVDSEPELLDPERPGPRGHEQRRPRRVWETLQGSGFVIDADGLILTALHVVGTARVVRVRTADERDLSGVVVGRDPLLDLALVRLDGASNLPAVALGDSGSLQLGQRVFALSNGLGIGLRVAAGIVSGTGRTVAFGPYDELVQTDTPLNPGDSGSPLFDTRGKVVGMGVAIEADTSGLGYAVAIDPMKRALPELRANGRVRRAALGVGFQTVTAPLATALGMSSARGALVIDLLPMGAAARSDVRAGDVVLAVDDANIEHADELARVVARHAPRSAVTLIVWRNKTRREVRVILDELPVPRMAMLPARAASDATDPIQRLLGLELAEAPDGSVEVVEVLDVARADEIEAGDVVLEVNGRRVRAVGDVAAALRAARPGGALLVKLRRGQVTRYAGVLVGGAH
jgi:serine protease Do